MRASASAAPARGLNENFTVRKISYGEGVERVFPLYSPMIDSIKVVRRGKVRRAKLYYLRGLRGKSARIAESAHHGGSGPTRPHGRIRHASARVQRPARPAFFVCRPRQAASVRRYVDAMPVRTKHMPDVRAPIVLQDHVACRGRSSAG